MTISIYLPNSKYGALISQEDSSLASEMVFAVADGVTRDPKLPKNFKGKTVSEILRYYPRPSGAYAVANIFCKKFIELVSKDEDIESAFGKINDLIGQYNKKKIKVVDYLVNDYFGCVACGGAINNNTLLYGCIGDCGVTIFDAGGKIKFQTKNQMQKFIDYENKFLKTADFNWSLDSYRVMVRSEYRNTGKLYKNKLISYGVLTGEAEALDFVQYGKKKLDQGDVVVFYSDGFSSLINSEIFSKLIRGNSKNKLERVIIDKSVKLAQKDYESFGHERSLIVKFL